LRFSSACRLNNARDYSAVFDKGQRFYLKSGMYISFVNSLNHARLGLIIAKKKIRRANQRNYLKRLQRECFRQSQLELLSSDIVFVANHKVAQRCQNEWFACCQADWQYLVKRLARA
jgi:ribonuclease P protein component